MKNIIIQATQYTPYIELDKDLNSIKISGKSYPENTFDFYRPIITWIEEFISSEEKDSLSVDMEIIYFNSSSSKLFFDFFDLLDESKTKLNIKIQWICDSENECAIEAGEDFKEDFESLDFQIVVR